jgi:hypothetical protein
MAMAQTAMVPQRRLSKSSIEAPTRTQPPRPHRNRLSQCAATPQCSRRVHSASLTPHLIGWLVCDQRQPQTRRPRCHQQTHRRPRRLFQLLPCQLLPCRQCCVLHWASAINPSGAFTKLASTGTRFRRAERKREANSDDGCAAQNSAHHRAAIELIHLRGSPNIELVREPTAREASAPPAKAAQVGCLSRRELRSRASAPGCAACGACDGPRP